MRGNLTLTATYTPAFHALADVAAAIALEHGPEVAAEWVGRMLRADMALFVRMEWTSKPELRVIAGGKG